jgi:hypothetical protein
MTHLRNLRRLTLCVAGLVLGTLPAHADAPSGQYSSTAGTVFDSETGLTWQQVAPTTGGDGGSGSHTLSSAQNYCSTLSLDGGAWRLPSVKELATLIDPTKFDPAIDTTANGFPGTDTVPFWSSTYAPNGSGAAYGVSFSGGIIAPFDAEGLLRVRCVR